MDDGQLLQLTFLATLLSVLGSSVARIFIFDDGQPETQGNLALVTLKLDCLLIRCT